jgi:hypothetical protein
MAWLLRSFQFHFEGQTRRRRANDEDSASSTAKSERGSQRSFTDEMELESNTNGAGLILAQLDSAQLHVQRIQYQQFPAKRGADSQQ